MLQANGNHANGSAAPDPNASFKKPAVDIPVALKANNLPAVPQLAKNISQLSTAAAEGDEESRLELVEKARQLVRSLETPRETMIKHVWAQVSSFSHEFRSPANNVEARINRRLDGGHRHRPLRCARRERREPEDRARPC
ncbi:hypothetical protein IMZ48_37960 [Candidatus Bathyarchaeota archaeon]|nr:hypothetical protein [Candidatus Bathyarchaeota archaeon]